MDREQNPSSTWLQRVEDIINVLEGSSVGEFELTEDGTEIIIRRSPGMVLTSSSANPDSNTQAGNSGRSAKDDQTIPIVAPLTGVYYSAASPSTPPFASPGDVIQVGQVIALVEAMKVFNEITSELTGRVVSLVATNGAVVQKGEVLLRIETI